MKVGVCENRSGLDSDAAEWRALCEGVAAGKPDLFVLNEMPFGNWIAAGERFDAAVWRDACDVHERGLARLGELGAATVAGSRPRELDGVRVNEAFLRDAAGVRGVHNKQYFPDEPGYYEARWFAGGERHFRIADVSGLRVGFLLCTEVMFNEHARHYGRGGAHAILAPRAVGEASLPRWLVAMRMAAVVSGCYVLTSNRSSVDDAGQRFGGRGWIIDPEGECVAETSESSPVAFHELDLDLVARAQNDYPCYVRE